MGFFDFLAKSDRPCNPAADPDLDNVARKASRIFLGSKRSDGTWSWYPTQLVKAYNWNSGGKIPYIAYSIVVQPAYAGDAPAVGTLVMGYSPDMARIEMTVAKFGYYALKITLAGTDFIIPETIPPLGPDRLYMGNWVQSAPVYRWNEWVAQGG